MKLKLSKLLLVIAAFLFAALIFDVLLRFFLPTPENLAKLRSSSLFLHENNPSVEFPYIREEFETLIKINSYGFRDDEFKKEKNKGVYRIAILGDSQEEALQVPLYDTWQKVMSRKLSEELDREVEAYNFGVSGYGTDQQWLTLREKVWQFSPDMVILAFNPNDIGDTYKNGIVTLKDGKLELISFKERAGGNFLGKATRWTYTYHVVIRAASSNEKAKRFVDEVRVRILGFPKEDRFFISDAQLLQGPFEIIASQENPPDEVNDAWEIVRALIFDMKKQADVNETEFLITINIPRIQVDQEEWESLRKQYNLDPRSSSPFRINTVINSIAENLGANFYDPREEANLWESENEKLHFKIDGHFNKNGNLFMGTKVAEYIVNEDLISK